MFGKKEDVSSMTLESKKRVAMAEYKARTIYIPQTKKIAGRRYFRTTKVFMDRLDAMKYAEKKREKGHSARIEAYTWPRDRRIKVYYVWVRVGKKGVKS